MDCQTIDAAVFPIVTRQDVLDRPIALLVQNDLARGHSHQRMRGRRGAGWWGGKRRARWRSQIGGRTELTGLNMPDEVEDMDRLVVPTREERAGYLTGRSSFSIAIGIILGIAVPLFAFLLALRFACLVLVLAAPGFRRRRGGSRRYGQAPNTSLVHRHCERHLEVSVGIGILIDSRHDDIGGVGVVRGGSSGGMRFRIPPRKDAIVRAGHYDQPAGKAASASKHDDWYISGCVLLVLGVWE